MNKPLFLATSHRTDALPIIPVNIQKDPPQIAIEGFSSDSLPERSPEQHTKNVEKSRRANIIFFGKTQNDG